MTPEDMGSNPDIGNFLKKICVCFNCSENMKIKKKRPRMDHLNFKKTSQNMICLIFLRCSIFISSEHYFPSLKVLKLSKQFVLAYVDNVFL